MNNKRKALVEYLVSVGGKKNSELSWSEILMMFEEKVNIKNIKKASDFWRFYQKTGKIMPHNATTGLTEDVIEKDPKILVYDIENSPKSAYVWGLWQQNVNPTNGMLRSDSFILTFSAKWLNDDKMMTYKLTPKEVKSEDDSRLVKILWNLLDEAKVVIGHNCVGFDNKIANTRFLLNGLIKPSHYQSIDTLKQARKHFRLPSNKLDYLGSILGLGRKTDTGGFSLWKRVLDGEQEALDDMAAYCDQDVYLLEDVYLALRPFITSHPNYAILTEQQEVEMCTTCGSKDLKEDKDRRTNTAIYGTKICNSCGARSGKRSAKHVKKQRKGLSPLSK